MTPAHLELALLALAVLTEIARTVLVAAQLALAQTAQTPALSAQVVEVLGAQASS